MTSLKRDHTTTKISDAEDRKNPYLSHLYDANESMAKVKGGSRSAGGDIMTSLKRHQTTAKMADEAENGPLNSFTGRPLSKKYFDILKTRRNLPVHLQR